MVVEIINLKLVKGEVRGADYTSAGGGEACIVRIGALAKRVIQVHAVDAAGAVVCVALANKNARILWAVMSKGQRYEPSHVSVKPAVA